MMNDIHIYMQCYHLFYSKKKKKTMLKTKLINWLFTLQNLNKSYFCIQYVCPLSLVTEHIPISPI